MGSDPKNEVPFAVHTPDRIPVQRYFDPDFYELEKKHLWPRAWQMACRLEEIPKEGDYAVYRNLDVSVIVIRMADGTVRAYQNHCRHRGVELVQQRGKAKGGFICPFHGWRWDMSGNNTFVFAPEAFSQGNMCSAELDLVPVRVETWINCAFINMDDNALPLRETLGEFGERMEGFKAEHLRAEWWLAARLPVNWKLAMEAFMEGYHVATTHPQLMPPGITNKPGASSHIRLPDDVVTQTFWVTVGNDLPGEVDAVEFVQMYCDVMQALSDGMAGMSSPEEVEVARSLVGMDLPGDPGEAAVAYRVALNNAIMKYYADNGMECGDINDLDRRNLATNVNFLFPHFFMLPVHGAAASYRIRPTGPEECIFELWSLKRYPKGKEPPSPPIPEPKAFDDPSWPAVPRQDFSNLPRQQRGLHSPGFEYMRLSDQMEGLISNFHRTLDGFLSGVPVEDLAEAMRVTSGAIDVEVRNLGL
ncbi:aromatic ring-hydroxylating oxygenase subunit alpha [Novosphingobium malaysiense]|uniref:aromatic ring-hydroxylating oxygenase subunit alpha n=1 Tax=Novosphingobium malaysiense TaxID=1348853 RepID=UPI0018CFBDCE|nr:aromatic ring-hydroxylating dioxygenase subunit alpha [Novosphingobium malaysiense]